MPGGLAVLPGPFGGGAFVVGQLRFVAAGGLQQALSIALEQAGLHVLPGAQVLAGGVEHSLAVRGHGETT